MQSSLSKTELQRLVLSAILLVAMVYCYHAFLLSPLLREKARCIAATADLQVKLDGAGQELQKLEDLQSQAGTASQRLEQLQGERPDGAAVAWLPPAVKAFFAARGVIVTTVRPVNTFVPKDPVLDQYAIHEWATDIAATDYSALGRAIADFENAYPLAAVKRFHMGVIPEDPGSQNVALTFTNVLKR